jgi:hypothetical protein
VNTLVNQYNRLFSIDEIHSSKLLQSVYWLLLTGFFLSFAQWINHDTITLRSAEMGEHICLPYFQTCSSLFFFDTTPHSYGQNIWYALLATTLTASAIFAARSRWDLAHLFLFPATIWKVLYVSVLTYNAQVDFEYFHIPLLGVFLLTSHRIYYLRRTWVAVYLLAATMKFTESWIVGNYFTSLKLGMPLFSDAFVPWITNGVALFEIISPWLLLSRKSRIRWGSLILWVIFHLYSIILVDFRYPLHCLPMLLLLFMPDPKDEECTVHLNRRSWPGLAFLIALMTIGLVTKLVVGDPLYTLQNMKFGVGMFDANHQCQSRERLIDHQGKQHENTWSSAGGMKRCGPYPTYFKLKQKCLKADTATIQWTFLSSVNGGPFYKIVDVPNICDLEYSTLGENNWLQDPKRGAEMVGFPKKNSHHRASLTQRDLIFDNQQIHLTPTQVILSRHLQTLTSIFWVLWIATAAFFVRLESKAWRLRMRQ